MWGVVSSVRYRRIGEIPPLGEFSMGLIGRSTNLKFEIDTLDPPSPVVFGIPVSALIKRNWWFIPPS